ncbi:MAG: response regulator [Phycisphaerae bacterium]|nr:response regulator [Phycisphaerae bacterium]
MAQEHILVIDDDPDVREALTMMLEPVGYRLTCCATGPEGMAAIERDPPDLILLDIMLASPSEGFHLAYELRRDERRSRIPIIMISSIGATMGMDYARELGSDYVPVEKFLDKPLTSEVVLSAVKETLGKSSTASRS